MNSPARTREPIKQMPKRISQLKICYFSFFPVFWIRIGFIADSNPAPAFYLKWDLDSGYRSGSRGPNQSWCGFVKIGRSPCSWIRIRIHNTDPEPGEPNQCGSGSRSSARLSTVSIITQISPLKAFPYYLVTCLIYFLAPCSPCMQNLFFCLEKFLIELGRVLKGKGRNCLLGSAKIWHLFIVLFKLFMRVHTPHSFSVWNYSF